MSDNSSASAIEVNGVNPVPDSERYGTPAGLFPIWFSWNISIFGITLGIYVLGLGLSVWQAMLAGVIGYFVSCALVGILAVGSVRTGLPTLVQSRFAFGYHGNKIPTFFGYVANMGWKVTMLSMASTTLADLMCHLVPVLAQVDGSPTSACVFGSFIVVIVLTMTGAVWGYQLIMKIEKAIAWITGLFTLVYLFFFIPQIDFSVLGDRPSAGIVEFLGAVVLSMTMVGLGFLNYGGDYSRYLPRNTRAGGVIFWTMTGIALPVSVLLILGGLWLIYKGYVNWQVPVVMIATVGILTGAVYGSANVALFQMMAGGLIIGAFFMATDMVTAPITVKGQVIFALGCGLITVLIRVLGGYPEGVCYSILLMNTLTPLIDRLVKPTVFGAVKTKGAK